MNEHENVGYLTWAQFERLERAVNNARSHVSWWRVAGHVRSGDPDEHRTRTTDIPLVLPATWLAAEEITRLLGLLNEWSELADAANDIRGQLYCMDLVREVESAMRKWPIADRPHRVKYLRCRACQQMTLRYYPPSAAGADISVRCSARECRAVEDPRMFERDAMLIVLEAERAGKTVGNRRRSGRGGAAFEGHDIQVGQEGDGSGN